MLEQSARPQQQPVTVLTGVVILIGALLGGAVALLFVPTPWWAYESSLVDLLLAAVLPFGLSLYAALLVLLTARAAASGSWRQRFRLAALALVGAILLGGLGFAIPLAPGLVLIWLAAHSRRGSEVPV
jgi:hypothetical protein